MKPHDAPLVKGYALACVIIFALLWITGFQGNAIVRAGFIPARFGSEIIVPPGTMVPFFLTPLTSAFLHGGVLHIVFNIIVLLFIGRQLEAPLGAKAMAVLLLAGAYAGAFAQFLADPQSAVPMIGASGAISAVIAVFALGQVLLAALRGRMVGVIARMPVQPAPPSMVQAAQQAGLDPAKLRVVDTLDEGFTGDWSGIQPDSLVVPLRWATLPAAALTAQFARRKAIADSGAHRRGVLGAIAWNTAGFGAVLALTGASPATAAGMVTLAAGMTLWP